MLIKVIQSVLVLLPCKPSSYCSLDLKYKNVQVLKVLVFVTESLKKSN